jgi:8-oxo-dGTP pyrophosphatase MutT (NUDIX family)
MRVVGCFLFDNDKFLILLRRADKSQGNTWGLPAGKVHDGESDEDAMIREIGEETGYLARRDELKSLGVHTNIFPDVRFDFPTFRIDLAVPFTPVLNPGEHTDYRWVTAAECDALPNLIHGFHDLLRWAGFVQRAD